MRFSCQSAEKRNTAKTAIHTFFYRIGDMMQAIVIWLGATLAFTPRHFVMADIAFIRFWLGVTFILLRTGPTSGLSSRRLSHESEAAR